MRGRQASLVSLKVLMVCIALVASQGISVARALPGGNDGGVMNLVAAQALAQPHAPASQSPDSGSKHAGKCHPECQHCAQKQCNSDLCNLCVHGAVAIQNVAFQSTATRPCLHVHVRQLPADTPQQVELRPPRRLLQI